MNDSSADHADDPVHHMQCQLVQDNAKCVGEEEGQKSEVQGQNTPEMNQVVDKGVELQKSGEAAAMESEEDKEEIGNSIGQKKVQAAAAIAEALVSPTRASPRLINSSGEHILKKAEKRTAEKNLESVEEGHTGYSGGRSYLKRKRCN